MEEDRLSNLSRLGSVGQKVPVQLRRDELMLGDQLGGDHSVECWS